MVFDVYLNAFVLARFLGQEKKKKKRAENFWGFCYILRLNSLIT